MIPALTLLVLKTRQVEPLRLFYQTLGLLLSEEQHGSGPVHFAGRSGDVILEIYPLQDDGSLVNSSTRLGLTVENVDALVKALGGIGTKMVTPTKETAWGLQAVVKDPDGRSVELTQQG